MQHGVFLPRFSIHSWNDDGTANEPWMYPEITPYVRELIKFRYRLIPYLYDLLWRYHQTFEPMMRPTFHDFPDDPRCFAENDDMLIGSKLLVASVVEPGQRARTVYLPQGANWYDYWGGEYFAGGQEITLPAPWDRPPLLVREGSILPLNLAEQHFAQPADERGFAVFPYRGDRVIDDVFFDDDGESFSYRRGGQGEWRVRIAGEGGELQVHVALSGNVPVSADVVKILLPRQELRAVRAMAGRILNDAVNGEWREVRLAL